MIGRVCIFIYGVLAYVLFLGTFVYAIGFVSDFLVPKTVDSGQQGSLGMAVLIDVVLCSLFAVQHSVMARPVFKRWVTRYVPRPVERSTFVLLTCVVLALLFWQWRPIAHEVWRIDNRFASFAIWAVAASGWLIVLASSFMIDHFELFGVKGALQYLTGQEPDAPEFKQPMLYRYVRHPLMLGFLIAFWATPVMTGGHLLFAATTTAYVLIAIQIEERDLVQFFGDAYRDYRRRVPMLLPIPIVRRNKAD